MENPISFSVIMPCYNSASYVETAVNSIIHQTYPHWELIAINDGSTDDTLNILTRYASHENRIKVFSKENGGYASAVNLGLDHISGTYFLFLGSDDYLSTDLFQSIVSQISNPSAPPDCIGFRARKIINGILKGNDAYTSYSTQCSEFNTNIGKFIASHPDNAAIFSIRDTCKCFKSSILGNLRYLGRYGIDADGIFSMCFARNATSFLSIPVDGYYWTIRSDSISSISNISTEKNIDRINNWHRFYEGFTNIKKENLTPPERNYLSFPLHTLIDLSFNLRNAIGYRHYIKNELHFFIRIAQHYAPEHINRAMCLAKISPIFFSVTYKIITVMRKIVNKTITTTYF